MRYTVKGVLRGYDTLVNLVLDETIEYLRGKCVQCIYSASAWDLNKHVTEYVFLDPEDSYKLTGDTRTLGLVVCRGGGVMAVYPTEGAAELEENPFL